VNGRTEEPGSTLAVDITRNWRPIFRKSRPFIAEVCYRKTRYDYCVLLIAQHIIELLNC